MTNPTQGGWGPCPRGAFGRLTATLAARRARRAWLTGLALVAGTVLTGAIGWQAAVAISDWQQARNRPAHHCQPSTPSTAPCQTGDCKPP